MAVVVALFSVVMATVGVEATAMGVDWNGRCEDEGDDPEEGENGFVA